MDLFSRLMGGMDFSNIQNMIPQKKIVDYKVINENTASDLEVEGKNLISDGYEPIGSLISHNGSLVREFVKYEIITPNVEKE